jgi:SPP1 gp7 family putative phage head morphogenesis protein
VKFWKAVDGAQARLAADQAEDLRTAITRSVDVDKVVDDWLRSHANTPSIRPSEARHWAKLNVRVDNTVTRAVWRRMLATGYVLGDDVAPVAVARSQLNKADAPDLTSIQTAINYDWSNWKAGNRAASALLQPPKGLAQLLAQTNASISGMDATTLDRLGTVLADSLNTGASVSATAQDIVREGLASSLKVGLENVLQDAQRAMTISRTEISRALNVSCRENYQELGVEKYEWLALEPCDDCEENDGEIVSMGDEFPSGDTEPPVHPNCRCTILPVIDEGVPAIEDTRVDEEPIEDVAPEMQDASDLLAVDTHPDLTVETLLPEIIAEPKVNLPQFWSWDKKAYENNYGGSKNDRLLRFMELRKQTLEIKLSDVAPEFKKLDAPETFKQATINSNPSYNPNHYAYSENCARVISAAEMRMRGYDVTATAKPSGVFKRDGSQARNYYMNAWVNRQTGITAWEERIHFDTIANPIEVDKAILAKYPEGARGFITQDWTTYRGAGHVYSWKIVNNEVRYFDAQTGKILDARLDPNGYHLNKAKNIDIARVDDKEPQAAILQHLKGWK